MLIIIIVVITLEEDPSLFFFLPAKALILEASKSLTTKEKEKSRLVWKRRQEKCKVTNRIEKI